MSYTVEGVSTMALFVAQCPIHGLVPVGFWQQLPKTTDLKNLTVTATVKCHDCSYSEQKTFKLIPKNEDSKE